MSTGAGAVLINNHHLGAPTGLQLLSSSFTVPPAMGSMCFSCLLCIIYQFGFKNPAWFNSNKLCCSTCRGGFVGAENSPSPLGWCLGVQPCVCVWLEVPALGVGAATLNSLSSLEPFLQSRGLSPSGIPFTTTCGCSAGCCQCPLKATSSLLNHCLPDSLSLQPLNLAKCI